jgi:tetratricopeptide (TPR) repeat protein/DNA-binding CsgD family transcriptional regulator
MALVDCVTSPDSLLEEEKLSQNALVEIDTLLWHHPDSALAVMMEFAGSEAADGMDVFEGHYCQVLVAELLYKNDYGQSNRTEVLKAVHYFDSIVGMDGADARGKADTCGVSVQGRDAFLAARAHYINGAGYYERDSLIEACGEYLNALRMMEGHFEEKVLVGHKARFMALTYNRLVELFSAQYMQEPAIYCGKQSLAFNRMAKSSPRSLASTLRTIGQQYDKLDLYDSATFYYNAALKYLPDRNDILYRDVVSLMAFSEHEVHHDNTSSLDSLKSMVAQAADEKERLTRYSTIGYIYYDTRQFDSAKVYLVPVFDKDPDRASMVSRPLREIALIEGDTVKANQYALVLAEEGATAANSQARVSQLNDLFQNYLQEKQEKALALERLEARRKNLWTGGMVALLAIAGLAVAFVTRRSHKKRLAAQEAEAKILNEEKQQLQARVGDAMQQLQTMDDALQQLQTQADDALQQARAMLPQRVADLYRAKVPNRLERIMDEFEAAYPGAMERVAATYPNLTKTETQLFVLSFLQFRAKEKADLLGLSQNTVLQYRSNLRKKTENASISFFLEA